MADNNHVIIIAEPGTDDDSSLRIQDFEKNGSSFIPVFSSVERFKELAAGSPWVDKGISIDLEMLLEMMDGNETLVINPGGKRPWTLIAQR